MTTDDLFYIGPNSSLWLRNASIPPGVYPIEFHVKNLQYERTKSLRIVILSRDHLWRSLEQFIPYLSQVMIILLTSLASLSVTFLLIYYRCFRSNVRKRLYGSRLIVNDEEKCSTMVTPNSRHKQRKVIQCLDLISLDNVSQHTHTHTHTRR